MRRFAMLLVVASCSAPPPGLDAGSDAGYDGGMPDAGALDSGANDAGTQDAGENAGLEDAGVPGVHGCTGLPRPVRTVSQVNCLEADGGVWVVGRWTRISPAGSAGPALTSIAYDFTTGQTLGVSWRGLTYQLADGGWEQLDAGVLPLLGGAPRLVWDPLRSRLVVISGADPRAATWDGDWQPIAWLTDGGSRTFFSAGFSEAARSVVYIDYSGRTWSVVGDGGWNLFSEATWSDWSCFSAALANDCGSKQLFTFGGTGPQGSPCPFSRSMSWSGGPWSEKRWFPMWANGPYSGGATWDPDFGDLMFFMNRMVARVVDGGACYATTEGDCPALSTVTWDARRHVYIGTEPNGSTCELRR